MCELRVLIGGSGRCGSSSLTEFLDGLQFVDGTPVKARHEHRADEIIEALLSEDYAAIREIFASFGHHIEVSPYLPLIPDECLPECRVVALIRDGRDTVVSSMNVGWYINLRGAERHWSNILPRFSGDRFAQCCQLWAWGYRRMEEWGARFYRMEDLADGRGVRTMLDELGTRAIRRHFPLRNRGRKTKTAMREAGVRTFPDKEHWSVSECDIFSKHCGDLMDRYYPEWQAWRRALNPSTAE